MKYDYLIVGQGLAGTLLAHFLREANQKVLIIDQNNEHAASRVAAGLINPITGRRYVKSWMVETLIPFAQKTYQDLEAKLDISFYYERPIIRTLFNQREENDWLLRTADPGYEPYMLDQAKLETYAEHTIPAFSYGEVLQSAQVRLPYLIEKYRQVFQAEGCLLSEPFDYTKIHFDGPSIQYGEIQAKNIVFCEGSQATQNPFFNYLPFGGAKGEVLIVRIPNANFEKIIKQRVFIAPLGEDLYWIGASYEWNFEDPFPTESGKKFLKERLEDFLKLPFEIVAHQSAVRPTVKDRRPFLGQHPRFSILYLFNGLGTKGASLGPYWAKQMCDYLINNQNLPETVNIRRYESFYGNE